MIDIWGATGPHLTRMTLTIFLSSLWHLWYTRRYCATRCRQNYGFNSLPKVQFRKEPPELFIGWLLEVQISRYHPKYDPYNSTPESQTNVDISWCYSECSCILWHAGRKWSTLQLSITPIYWISRVVRSIAYGSGRLQSALILIGHQLRILLFVLYFDVLAKRPTARPINNKDSLSPNIRSDCYTYGSLMLPFLSRVSLVGCRLTRKSEPQVNTLCNLYITV